MSDFLITGVVHLGAPIALGADARAAAETVLADYVERSDHVGEGRIATIDPDVGHRFRATAVVLLRTFADDEASAIATGDAKLAEDVSRFPALSLAGVAFAEVD